LTVKGSFNDRFARPMNYNKWAALEERLRVVEANNLIDPIQAAKVCLVSNIVVPKKFRMLEFIKYIRLKCLNTHLWSYYNKIAEVIYNDKILIYFLQDNLSRSALSWYMKLDNI